MERPSFLWLRPVMREAPTQGTAPERLKANSRSLQRLMLRRREPNRSYHENPYALPHWLKVKNPKAPAVKREAEED
jgi:hypothetical protein